MMKKVFLYSFLFILSFLSINHVQAQKITVETQIDSTVIWIGEQTAFSLQVTQSPEQSVIFPLFSDNIPGGLDIVEPLKVDTVKTDGTHLAVKHNYVVTAFEDSLLFIPPFPFVVDGDTVWSNSTTLKVVQPFEINMEENAITDIKPVYTPPFNWLGLLKWVLLVILILALALGLFILIRKYIQKKPVFEQQEVIIERPPHIVALEGLDKIKDEKTWQQGRIKEYYTELTDVVRTYTGKLFGTNAMEMTSDELLDALRFLRKENKEAYEKLIIILGTADLAKFAKWKPTNEENENCLKEAYSFVEITKPEDEPVAEEKTETKEETEKEEN